MAVSFVELDGSPKERWDENGMSATRQFRVAWLDRYLFVIEMLGNGYQFGSIVYGSYPGVPGVFAISASCEPMGMVQSQVLSTHYTHINAYEYARITIEYKFAGADFNDDQPNNFEDPRDEATQETTRLQYRQRTSTEMMVFTGTDVIWESTAAIPEAHDFEFIFRVSIIEHIFTFGHVANPPFSAIRNAEGKLNDLSILGAGKGLVLFDGCEMGRDYVVADDEEEVRTYWAMTYTLREKRIHTGEFDATGTEVVRGWNWAYRSHPEADAGWYMIQLKNGKYPYQYGNLGALFLEETDQPNLHLQGDDQVAVA